MYIPYELIGSLIKKITNNNRFDSFFYNKKVEQNLKYIEKNKPKVINKLKNKLKNNKKLNVVFYVYDSTKWKCQSIYNFLKKDNRFEPKIIATKSSVFDFKNPTFQTDDDILKTYDFFSNKEMNVEFGFDIKKQKHVPLKKFSPDIIFYQHPWYVETSQGPVVCSKFALTCYVPYYFIIEVNKIDYYLRFHKYVENYYVLNEQIKQIFSNNMDNCGKNIKALGYPFLDNCINTNEQKYTIYAPHWTVGENNTSYSTFEWSGKFMLEYAKEHKELNWIFKPHPLLYKALINNKIMNEEEAKSYYNEWEKIGIKYENGDYLELFDKSKMMITDCSSFLGEYFIFLKPLIHLMSDKSQFNYSKNPILKTYYKAKNEEELMLLVNTLPQNDSKKNERNELLKELDLQNNNASKNIIDDILNILDC